MPQMFKNEMEVEPSIYVTPGGYSVHAAYFAWYALGYIGAHNFYLKRFYPALIQSTLFTIGFLTIPQKFGIFPLLALTVLMIWDFIHIPKWVREKNAQFMEAKIAVPHQEMLTTAA